MSILCEKKKNYFDYILFDGSYLLTRKTMAMIHYDLDYINVGRLLSDTLNLIYEFLNNSKVHPLNVFFLWDKWDNEIKGYYRTKDLQDYKGDRYYHSEEGLNELIESGASESEINDYKKKLQMNQVKQKAKKIIIDRFGEIGMPSILFPGYEADDLAKAFCDIYRNDSNIGIVTKDSDWKFLIGGKAQYIDLLNYEFYNESRVREEEHVSNEIPSLYTFKCLLDSMYGSHNNLQPTVNKSLVNYKIKKYDAVTRTFSGDRSLILPDKLELFKTHVNSFKIRSFPRYSELEDNIRKSVQESTGFMGHLSELKSLSDEFDIKLTNSIINKYESQF